MAGGHKLGANKNGGENGIMSSMLVLVIVIMLNMHRVHEWEKDVGYPYGKMCNSIFTGFVDTCRH